MPAVSRAQMGLMGVELARRRKGQKPRMEMSEGQLEEYLQGTKAKDLPARKLGKALRRGK